MRASRHILLCAAACAFGIASARAADDPPPSGNPIFAELPVLEAAALHTQTIQEAPAKVTVISAEDIRTYGYRTLGEALASVPGFYSAYDRIYHYFGVRGFLISGDYNTRFLVMLNGRPLTDNVYDSNNLFGQDFGLDLDLVARIEVICGPTSALYGSNGILANINIVTKSPVDFPKLRVSTETGSFGEKKAVLTSSTYLGHGANLLLSASAFYNGGETLVFPGEPPAAGLDGERGYHTFATVAWSDWTFTALFGNRDKAVPVPWGEGALSLHRGNQVRDSRNLVSADWTHSLRNGAKLRWQLHYDQYLYDDRFDYPDDRDGLTDVRSLARGDWVGTQASYQFSAGSSDITAGGQIDVDIRNLQQDRTVYPERMFSAPIQQPEQRLAAFLQEEWHVTRRIDLSAGLRLDHSGLYGSYLSPRLALVWQPSPHTSYKLIWGMPFRNPSRFEAFYTDGGAAFLANPSLRRENAQMLEVAAERKLRHLSVAVSAYRYQISNLIEAAYLEGGVSQYGNLGRARSMGMEVELKRKTAALEFAGSYAFEAMDNSASAPAWNAPSHIAKARAALPLAGDRLKLSSALQYMTGRQTFAGGLVRPVLLGDVTLSTNRLHPHFDIQVGLRNVAGWRYSDPAGLALDRMPGQGRAAFVKLIWRGQE